MLLAFTGGEAKPIEVFILAGQSNMEGPANICTFDYIGDNPATALLGGLGLLALFRCRR